MAEQRKPAAFGIDLGTTNTVAAVYLEKEQRCEVIRNELSSPLNPSCVAFVNGKIKVGMSAQMQLLRSPKCVVYEVKRLIGLKFDDPKIADDLKRFSFDVIGTKAATDETIIWPTIKIEDKQFSPEEVSFFH